MTTSRKAALSLFITVLVLAVFTVIAFTGLFNLIETRFYDPAVRDDLYAELKNNAAIIDEFINENDLTFEKTIGLDSVKRSFLVDQNGQDILDRSKIFGELHAQRSGLQWVRFIDQNGQRIHFSTDENDIADKSAVSISYKSYSEVPGYVPFDDDLLKGSNTRRIVFDDSYGDNERLLFYYPFADSQGVYRGEAVFSITVLAIAGKLKSLKRIKTSEDISIITAPKGLVIGLPDTANVQIKNAIASIWESKPRAKIDVVDSQNIKSENADKIPQYVLLYTTANHGFIVGSLIEEGTFDLPSIMKIVLLFSLFLSAFLLLFLIFNTAQNPVTVVQGRLKTLQVNLLNEYYQLKSDMDWSAWQRELEIRRPAVLEDLKRGIRIKKDGSVDRYINSFFDKSWDDLLLALGSRSRQDRMIDEEKLEEILKRVLSTTKISVASINGNTANGTKNENFTEEQNGGEVSDIEELDDIEDAEDIEELEELGDLEDAEDVESFADAGSTDDLVEEFENNTDAEDIHPIIAEAMLIAETSVPMDEDQDFGILDNTLSLNNVEEFDEADDRHIEINEEEISAVVKRMEDRAADITVLNLFNPDENDSDFDFELEIVSPAAYLNITGCVEDWQAASDEKNELDDKWQQLADDAEREEEAVGLMQAAEIIKERVKSDQTVADNDELTEFAAESADELSEFAAEPADELTEFAAEPADELTEFAAEPADELTEFAAEENVADAVAEDQGNDILEVAIFDGSYDFSVDEDSGFMASTGDSDIDSVGVQLFEEVTGDDVEKYSRTITAGPAFTYENPHKGTDLNAIAKRIEFAPGKDEDKDDDFALNLDVSSPLASIELSNISSVGTTQVDTDEYVQTETYNDEAQEENIDNEEDAKVEKTEHQSDGKAENTEKKFQSSEYLQNGLDSGSLQYRPFSSTMSGELEYLENADSYDTEDQSRSNTENLIEERGGVNYIDAKALRDSKDGIEKVDQNMKVLVDTVLRN
ncbi:MAG: hypothetical protein Ta2B_23930 [Termitinemataceae bacterium]|nr:MAG: hypothetical protein Ta2B_23930 [Termitinemataceae bacterium]